MWCVWWYVWSCVLLIVVYHLYVIIHTDVTSPSPSVLMRSNRFAPRRDNRRFEDESGEPEVFRLARGTHLPPRRVVELDEEARMRADLAHDDSVRRRFRDYGSVGQLLAPMPFGDIRRQAEQLSEQRAEMQRREAASAQRPRRVPTVRNERQRRMRELVAEREAEERDVTNHIYDRARRDLIIEDYNEWVCGDGTGYRSKRTWTHPLFPVLEALDIRPFDEGAYHILRHVVDGMHPSDRDETRWPFDVMDDLMTSAQDNGPLFGSVLDCGMEAPWAKDDSVYDDDVPSTEAVSVVEEGTGDDVVPEGVAVVSDAVNETQA